LYAIAAFTDWLTGIGGFGAFAATTVLAVLARAQMKAAQAQVAIMRKAAASENATVREQIAASIAQGEAIREAARAQLQPIVFGHAVPIVLGPNDEYSISAEDVAFAYYIQNEGTGIALNIRHGVEIAGVDYEYGDGKQVRALRPGEALPPRDPIAGTLIWRVALSVVRPRRDLPKRWDTESRNYWANFENVFGERFVTRNPSDPSQPARFERLNPKDKIPGNPKNTD
jgi:hypothetical protein